MLVLGWTLMGRRCSSYDYTMGFGVSARVENRDSNKLSTRYMLSSLLSSNKFSLSARRSLALYDFYRRITTSQKSDKATRIAVKTTGARLFLSSTPPYLFSKIKWLSCIIKFKLSPLERGTSEIRGLQISYNKTSKMPNSDAEIVFGHDRFIIGHDSRCAERRGLCLLT